MSQHRVEEALCRIAACPNALDPGPDEVYRSSTLVIASVSNCLVLTPASGAFTVMLEDGRRGWYLYDQGHIDHVQMICLLREDPDRVTREFEAIESLLGSDALGEILLEPEIAFFFFSAIYRCACNENDIMEAYAANAQMIMRLNAFLFGKQEVVVMLSEDEEEEV